MFPGGNTSRGFFSYYSYILAQEEARRIFVIKGGPGVGKSTFMKKIAQEMLERGYDAEFMHCSSDNNSLDGLVLPALKVAFIDGTAPHVVDPKNPGAVDEIIHLGDFWDEAGMVQNKEQILAVNKEVGTLFARAYRYLRAAASIYEDTAVINGWALDDGKVNRLGNELVQEFFGDIALSDKTGKQRCLFASAITPDGLKNHLNTILNTGKVIVLEEAPGCQTVKLLEKIKDAAAGRGFDTECYFCALFPEKLEHLVIPALDISFTTSNASHHADVDIYRKIDLTAFLDRNVLAKYEKELSYNASEFGELLGKTIETISNAKALHDKMETYYIPNMDFDAVQRCWEATLGRVLEYAGEL
jgi:hypothetical protein